MLPRVTSFAMFWQSARGMNFQRSVISKVRKTPPLRL
jgi:hypothetical protein